MINFIQFTITRAALSIVTLLIVCFIVFSLMELVPGTCAERYLAFKNTQGSQITFEDIETHEIKLMSVFIEIRTAFLKGVEPVQAVKKGYINSIDEHPNNKNVEWVTKNTVLNNLKKTG